MKEIICTMCARGCRLAVDEETLRVTGNACDLGKEYGKNEITAPKRTVTGSVAIRGAIHARLPVRTDKPVPKEKIFDVMDALHSCTVDSPVKMGDVIIENVCGTDANIIATRNM